MLLPSLVRPWLHRKRVQGRLHPGRLQSRRVLGLPLAGTASRCGSIPGVSSGAPFRARLLCASLLLTGLLFVTGTSQAQIEGASYTLQPSYSIVRWNDKVGIKDTELFGGRLSVNLGQYVALQGFYMTRSDVGTDLASINLEDLGGNLVQDQKTDIRHYGADVVFNLSRGPVVPFVKAGGGIITFDTAAGNEQNQIAANLGGGVRFGIDRLNVEVFVEDKAFRVNRYDLGVIENEDLIPTKDNDEVRHNLTVGAGLNFHLGGYSGGGLTETDHAIADRFRSGLSGLSVPIELYAGRLDFDDDVALATQEMVGVRTGLDFGRYFGLRGYYWRGVNGDFDDTEPIESWGGEANFRLNAGQGTVPYLLLGVGQLAFRDEYRDEAEQERDDKTMLILGGGLDLSLGGNFLLRMAARNHLFSQKDLEDVAASDELVSNWMLSAGIQFGLGGGGPERISYGQARDEDRADVRRADRASAEKEGGTRQVQPGEEKAGDTQVAEQRDVPARQASVSREIGPETMTYPVSETDIDIDTGRQAKVARAVRTAQGDRIVTFPVPDQGEIYIRYGQPGGVSIQTKTENRTDLQPDDMTVEAAVSAKDTVRSQPPRMDEASVREAVEKELRQELRDWERPMPVQETAPRFESPGSINELAELLSARIDKKIEARIGEEFARRMPAGEGEAHATEVAVDVSGPAGREAPRTRWAEYEQAEAPEFRMEPHRLSLRQINSYLGATVNDPYQALFGARLNLGTVTANSPLLLLPEVVIGVGSGGPSFMVTANVMYQLYDVVSRGDWSPYATAGAGLLIFDKDVDDRPNAEGVFNLSYGVAINFGRYTAYAEHQGIDLFDLHRILAGVRWDL